MVRNQFDDCFKGKRTVNRKKKGNAYRGVMIFQNSQRLSFAIIVNPNPDNER